jgi:hypothetical protein
MYQSIWNLNIPPPGISQEFDVKSSAGSLPCSGVFGKGGEFEPEVLTFCPFSRACCTQWRWIQFSQILKETRPNFVKNWLKEMGMEKLCAFEGMYTIYHCVKLLN